MWKLPLTILDADSGAQRDVIAEVSPDETVHGIAKLLDATELHRMTGPLDQDARLEDVDVAAGEVLVAGKPRAAVPRPEPALRCVGGRFAGERWSLDGSAVVVGRGPSCDVVLRDDSVSGEHAELTRTADGWAVQDLGSTNGTHLNGVPIASGDSHRLEPGDTLLLGPVLLELDPGHEISQARLHRQPDGTRVVRRQPRQPSRPRAEDSDPPREPRQQEEAPVPWPTFLTPVAIGIVGALVFARVEMLLFVAIGPVGGATQMWWSRRHERRREHAARVDYEAELQDFESRRAEAARKAGRDARQRFPDPTVIEDMATRPTPRLWERRPDDERTLQLRVGTASVVVDESKKAWTADAPQVLDLVASGVVGLAGRRRRTLAVARWLVAQAAVLHAPEDLDIVIVGPDAAAASWRWVRWLPHTGATTSGPASLALDEANRTARIAELVDEIDARREDEQRRRSPVVVVVDGADDLRMAVGLSRVLRDGPAVGVYTIGIDQTIEQLPEEVTAKIVLDGGDRLVDMSGAIHPVLPDEVGVDWAERVARPLVGYRLDAGTGSLPSAVRLVDELEGAHDPERLAARWREQTQPSTTVTLGREATRSFRFDLRADGPHALLVGTTGSGKTGTLLAMISSLALGSRPDSLNMVLADWKGGGDFADTRSLPHVRTVVSNLDRLSAERAIRSIGAEVQRRQAVLAELAERRVMREANVTSLWRSAPEEARANGMPVLVVVIDEFNMFLENVPELVDELLAVTAQGRSLGVHLILSMQQVPGGAAMRKLGANISLRIVLRTQKGWSREVLDDDVADRIPNSAKGRGYVKVGEPPRLVEFQTGYLLGPAVRGSEDDEHEAAGAISPWSDGQPDGDHQEVTGVRTDLTVLCDTVKRASIGISRPPTPIPPPLPARLPLADLWPEALPSEGPPAWGRIDEPGALAVEDRARDLPAELATFAVVGSPGTGRTTALLSYALALTAFVPPDRLHVHAVDTGNGGLHALDVLPHAGTIAVADPARTHRLLEHVVAELRRRQQDGVAEQDASVLVLIDTIEAVVQEEGLHGAIGEHLQRIAREGPAARVYLVVAGERRALQAPMSGLIGDRLVLDLHDPGLYGAAGMRPPASSLPPGRARRSAQEFVQVAEPGEDLDELARAVSEAWAATGASATATRLRALPRAVVPDDLTRTRSDGPLHLRIGLGGDDAAPVGIDLAIDGPAALIVGPRGSGRTTALAAAAVMAERRGLGHLVVSPSPGGPLRAAVASHEHCIAVVDRQTEVEDIAAQLEQANGPVLLLVDDAAAISGSEMDALLNAFLDGRGIGRAAALVALDPEGVETARRGIVVTARRAGAGIVFSPDRISIRHVGLTQVPDHVLGRTASGRGVLARAGRWIPIQVAEPVL